jgi:hypothetical protein
LQQLSTPHAASERKVVPLFVRELAFCKKVQRNAQIVGSLPRDQVVMSKWHAAA